jgi:hypothetical protein
LSDCRGGKRRLGISKPGDETYCEISIGLLLVFDPLDCVPVRVFPAIYSLRECLKGLLDVAHHGLTLESIHVKPCEKEPGFSIS